MSQDYLPPLHLSPALQRVDWQALPIPGSPRWHRWREARKAGMDIETWLMQEAGMPTGVPAAAPVAGSDEAWGEGRE